ncbi:MAG: putative bifunctional diguanylate cyclase/phosphodiesterase, partial [Acidimicrobiales bacterium]
DLDALLDATVAALAALTLAWVYLISRFLNDDQPADFKVRLILAFYPPFSVFLVAIVASLAFSANQRPVIAFRLVLLGMASMLVGDVIYMLVDTRLWSISQQFVDLPYGMAYLLFTVAVLHPSMRLVSEPPRAGETPPRRARLVLVGLALCIPALVGLTQTSAEPRDRAVLGVIVLALTATVSLRVSRALTQHARSEARLIHQAQHDTLTGLPNRTFVQDHLTRALARGAETGHGVAVLFLDVDRFKTINDTLGHSMGDELLVSVSRRLRANLREDDLVGRVGGDEFVIVIQGVRDAEHAIEMAERVRLGFAVPFRLRDAEIPTATSIGVALQIGTGRPVEAEAMLGDADSAMYQVKDIGGDAVVLFDSSMRDRAERRLELERELSHALDRGQLSLSYQPVIQLHDSRVTGVEALVRWNHPTLGPVPPDVFIPVAEDTGLIIEIGAWVIDQACAQLAALRATVRGGADLSMAVNISARQLRGDSLLDTVARALMHHSLPASSLCLELTESLLMENVGMTSKLLSALRSAGVRISVDDFGTGYSSLAYLKRLPVDEVKIDRSFVSDLDDDGANTSLVAAVVAIAASLGISTVAEGVEKPEQAARLHQLGCNEAQGYWFSRPVPADEIAAVMEGLGLASERRLRIVRDLA